MLRTTFRINLDTVEFSWFIKGYLQMRVDFFFRLYIHLDGFPPKNIEKALFWVHQLEVLRSVFCHGDNRGFQKPPHKTDGQGSQEMLNWWT